MPMRQSELPRLSFMLESALTAGKEDLAKMDSQSLHQLVYDVLLPRIEARADWETCQKLVLRFKVLGGLGPAATADFQLAVIDATPAARDRQHLRLDVKVDPLIGKVEGHSPIPLTQEALDSLLGENGERTAFCMPCNSAHWRIDQLEYDRENVLFVSMIVATTDEVAASHPDVRRIGLLATKDMVDSGIYQKAFSDMGAAVFPPSALMQEVVNALVYGGDVAGVDCKGVKGGDTGPAPAVLLQKVIDDLYHQYQVEAFCVSCTELPFLIGQQRNGEWKGNTCGLPVVNSTQALARQFVHRALTMQAEHLLDFEMVLNNGRVM